MNQTYNNYYWLNDEARTFLSRGYISESAEDRIKEIATKAEEYLGIEGFAEKFETYMAKGYYSLSTPVWINFGKNKGLPISCYGSNVPDTMNGILDTAREIGLMSKYGGGTSAYLGNLRPRGTAISTGGHADGPVHYAMLYDTVVDVCKQSEARRGACAVYLPLEHKDIDEFLNIATEGNPIQNLQYGVSVSDQWLQEMKNGDTEKRKKWAKVIQRRSEIGFPYILFKDNANNNTPYKDLNMEITASNLCLTADQRVLTSKGYLTVKELEAECNELVLFNGQEKVMASPMLLRDSNSEILKITYANGMTQKVSPNHGIAVINDTEKGIQRVEAKDLKIGDYVATQTQKGLFGDLNMSEEAFLLGSYQSKIQLRRMDCIQAPLALDTEKPEIPSWLWISTEETVWSYLNGLLCAHGIVSGVDTDYLELYYLDTHRDFLAELQILFTNLGLSCHLEHVEQQDKPEKRANLSWYRLVFNTKKDLSLIDEKTHILCHRQIDVENIKNKEESESRTRVWYIEKLDNEPVYCPTVFNDEHIFVSNGLKTFNCSEIMLPTDHENSFVCCIGSINLLHWDEIENTDAVETYIQFLNAVMDEFIVKSNGLHGMERANNFAKNHRAIGLGVLGYHSFLQSKLIPFESLKAKYYNNHIFKTIRERSENTSMALYESNPSKYACIRPGYANTTLIAIAPTKSSSFILGQVSMGIEPIKSNYFVKDLAKIRTIYKNPYLLGELEKYGLNNEQTWDSIMVKDGSVQHLDFPTKEVFKTFLEISPKEIVLQAAQRQKYIDQSQSLNLMIHPSISAKDINQLYLYAHEEGVKTLYYQYSQNSAQAFARNILECVNCE